MRATLLLHIAAGGLGLITGFLALYAAKGAPLHRGAGRVFVYAMVTMCGAGLLIAVLRQVAPAINVPAGLLTAALVVTGLTTVTPATAVTRYLNLGAMLAALAVGLTSLAFGAQALALGGSRDGMPAFPFFMFGVIGVIAATGDLRMLRAGEPRGAARLRRHLWRMSTALFIAALSFFIGQAKVIPAPFRNPALLALPVLAVLVTMLYWLWRVRARRSLPAGIVATGIDTAGRRAAGVYPAAATVGEPPLATRQ